MAYVLCSSIGGWGCAALRAGPNGMPPGPRHAVDRIRGDDPPAAGVAEKSGAVRCGSSVVAGARTCGDGPG